MEYYIIYDNNVEKCRIDCVFDMGEISSWDIKFSRDESIDYIYNSPYYEGETNFDETTGKYSFVGHRYIMEWTYKNIDKVDTYSVKCTEEFFKEEYSEFCSDMPREITQSYR